MLTGGPDGARFYINDDAGSFVTGALGLTWAAGDIGARVADLDGDARDDLVVYGADGLKVWFNRLAGFERADEASLGLDVGEAVTALAVVDLDGDGDHDLIVGTAAGVQVLRSHLSLLQAADYRWALLDIRRAVQLAPGPRDAVGAVLYQSLVADQMPERLLVPGQPMAPVLVTLGEAMSSDVIVHFMDLGMPGMNTRAVQIVMELWSSVIEVRGRE